jgi:hypothetical protein
MEGYDDHQKGRRHKNVTGRVPTLSPALYFYKNRLKIPFVYQVMMETDVHRLVKGVRLISADRFLGGLA